MRRVLIPLTVALFALSAVPLMAAGDGPKGKATREDDEKKGEKKSAGDKDEQRGERKAKDEGKGSKLPKAVAEAVKSVFPGMKVVKSEEEDEDGAVVYAVTLRGKHGSLEAKVTPKGRVVEVEIEGDDEDEGKSGQKGEKEKEKAKGKEKEKDDERGEKGKEKGKEKEDDKEKSKGKKKDKDD